MFFRFLVLIGGIAITQKYRINEKIRTPEVRLIDDKGQNRGVVSILEARRLADEAGFDLVEVSGDTNPPVCRILDYGKLKYQQKKKEQQKKKIVQLKEIRLRPRISEHDMMVKLKQIQEFLSRGDKVLVTLNFRGREIAHADMTKALMDKITAEVEAVARVERTPRMEGRRMSMMLVPKNAPITHHSDAPISDDGQEDDLLGDAIDDIDGAEPDDLDSK